MAYAFTMPLGARFYRVGELVTYVRELFAADPVLADVWVSGEVSELTLSSAGHYYFTIRDNDGRIPVVMFRSAARRQTLTPIVGHQVLAHGTVSIYEQRSVFQLIADLVLPGDSGRLQAQFEALRLRLDQEGLFAAERKRTLPRLPQRIGVVTSESGAVLHDMMNVWKRRFRCMSVVFAPATVQGEDAPRQIVAALRRLNAYHVARGSLDLIVLARGGGSPEELAVFNDERVARAVFASRVPIVSAIGHQVDFSITDYVADVRAGTPSAAAEVVVPDQRDLAREIDQLRELARTGLVQRVADARLGLRTLEQRTERRSPRAMVDEWRRGCDEAAARGQRALTTSLTVSKSRIEALRSRLEALSPETTMRRGYAVCSRAADGAIITDAAQLSGGDQVVLRLARGRATGQILSTEAPNQADEDGERRAG